MPEGNDLQHSGMALLRLWASSGEVRKERTSPLARAEGGSHRFGWGGPKIRNRVSGTRPRHRHREHTCCPPHDRCGSATRTSRNAVGLSRIEQAGGSSPPPRRLRRRLQTPREDTTSRRCGDDSRGGSRDNHGVHRTNLNDGDDPIYDRGLCLDPSPSDGRGTVRSEHSRPARRRPQEWASPAPD